MRLLYSVAYYAVFWQQQQNTAIYTKLLHKTVNRPTYT